MTKAWEDPRIVSGMQKQLRRRRELLEQGRKPLGWKLAFGGPAAMQRLNINAPLVGFLMSDARVASGSTISLAGWTKPAAEPELTVYVGEDLASNADRNAVRKAIAGLGAAIEVADVDLPSEDVEATLARNIYQRHLILGDRDTAYAGGGLAGLRAHVERNGAMIGDTADLEALTGELLSIVGHVANLLSFFGEKLGAGEIIIAGSITPPVWVQAGEHLSFQLQPQPAISVNFSA